MEIKLTITLILVALFLIILTTHFLRKGRIPEKYALLWYGFSVVIIISSFIPKLLSFLAKLIGFKLISNMILVILIGVLFLLVMALTIMMAGQKKKTTLLIQELSILKSEIKKNEKQK